MTRTITHLYDTYEEAARAVRILEDAGIRSTDISIVGSDRDNRYGAEMPNVTLTDRPAPVGGTGDTARAYAPAATDPARRLDTDPATGAGAGASVGTVVGGGAGLLAGIGALAIPGVGPVVAAGWLIATLTGAGVGAGLGGILGSLVGSGHPEDDAHVLAEGVRRGGTLVSVRADDADAPRVESLLQTSGRVDLSSRAAEYRAAGWERFDQTGTIETTGATGIGTTTSEGQVLRDATTGAPVPADPLASPVDVERQRLGSSTHV